MSMETAGMFDGEDIAAAEARVRARRRKAKKIILAFAATVCAATWIAMGIGLAMGVSKTTGIVLVTLAAVSTEGLFWVGALVLGVTMVQSRREILAWMRARIGL